MREIENNRAWIERVRGQGRRRWGAVGLAGTVALLLVATLVQVTSTAAAAADNAFTVNGWPSGQANLKVWRTNCSDSNVIADDDWAFQTVAGSPAPFGPTAIGWTPTGTGGGYGIEAYYPDATAIDVFQAQVNYPAGIGKGFAEVHYYPGAGNVDWYGYSDDGAGTDPDFVDDQDGWHTLDASDLQYDWYPLTNDGPPDPTGVVQNVTIADFTATHGAGTAWARIFLGCNGNTFYVDGFQLGSAASGVDTYNFEDFVTPTVSLSQVGGRINTCHVSAPGFPQKVSFRGRTNPGGPWEGQQYVGRRHGHWRVVARGNTSGQFRYTAKIYENSYFDAVRPWTLTTRFVDSSPDWYVPAFPNITVRASSTTVRQGKTLVFTGSIKPGRGHLSYTPLRAEANGRKWTRFQSLGTKKTDAKGHFRFTVKATKPGWARINILTKTERDLTSALTPRAILYEVLKPKKKKHHVSPPNQTSDPVVDNGEQPDPTPDPSPDPPPPFVPRVAGYGNCGWYPTGSPPRQRIGPEARSLVESGNGSLATRPDGEPLPTATDTGRGSEAPDGVPVPVARPRPSG